MNNVGIYVGTVPETVVEVKKSIMEILNARCDQETMRAALAILGVSVSSGNTSINNCNLDMTRLDEKATS